MIKSHKKSISLTITLISVVIIVIYIYINRQIFAEIGKVRLIFLLPMFFLYFFQLYLNGLMFKLLVRPFGIDLKEHFDLSVIGSFINLLSPLSAGSGMRALYMKQHYTFAYKDFFSTLLGNYVILFFVNSFFALITFAFVYIDNGTFNLPFSIFFLVMFLVSTLCVFSSSLEKIPTFSIPYLRLVIQGWEILRKNRFLVFQIMIIGIFNILVFALTVFFSHRALGVSISFSHAWYISIINTLLVFVNITPSGIGLQEGLFVLSGQLLYISPAFSLVVALLQRAVNVLVITGFTPFSNYRLSIGDIRDKDGS